MHRLFLLAVGCVLLEGERGDVHLLYILVTYLS